MACLDLEALLHVPHVDPYSGFDVSPDGNTVAFSWNRIGRWEIYEVALDGSSGPLQVTQGGGGKFAPRYAPDGARIAYVLDVDGSEALDACIYDRQSQVHTNLTLDLPGALQPNLSWCPDGSQLAFISDRSGRFDTYVALADGGAPRPVLALPYSDWDVRWSPDGRHLAVVAATTGQDHGVFIVPSDGGEPFQLAVPGGPINAREPEWAPDGSRLAFTSNLRGSYDIGVYDLEAREIIWVTESNFDDETPGWSPQGDRLVFLRRQGATTVLAVALGGDVDTYQVSAGVHYLPRFTPDGEHVVFVFDSPRDPQDLWVLSLVDREVRRLTRSLPEDLDEGPFTMPTEIRYPGMDGQGVPALLYLPAGLEAPAPTVLVIHGGPSWISQQTWTPVIQHFVSRGWIVLAPNYRGSIGYGRQWQLANRYDLGGVDTRDVVAGADYLVQERRTDPNRIAVTGWSHGGYLTMTCLTHYPDRWAAGSAVVPFLNWFTAHRNCRRDLQYWDIENMGDPVENHDLWYERSPLFFLDRIRAPVQLICSANDPRCPASESIEARDALIALGKSVELTLYPDEGHQFLKRENLVDAERKRAAFLARALER